MLIPCATLLGACNPAEEPPAQSETPAMGTGVNDRGTVGNGATTPIVPNTPDTTTGAGAGGPVGTGNPPGTGQAPGTAAGTGTTVPGDVPSTDSERNRPMN
jgi:hypothetical protein